MRSRGARVWIDEAEIKLGDSLVGKIQEALDTFEYVGAVISSNSVGSEWVQRELEPAIMAEIETRTLKVLPLRLDDCAMPAFLRGKKYADFRRPDNYVSAVEMIAERLGLPTQQIVSLIEG